MTACFLGRNLLFYARIADAAERAGVPARRVDSPDDLPPPAEVTLLVVDWADRAPDWGERLAAWCSGRPPAARLRIVLYGSHTDLKSHAAARAAGLGPMWARSKLVTELPALFGNETAACR